MGILFNQILGRSVISWFLGQMTVLAIHFSARADHKSNRILFEFLKRHPPLPRRFKPGLTQTSRLLSGPSSGPAGIR
jgi:hypothetical protein